MSPQDFVELFYRPGVGIVVTIHASGISLADCMELFAQARRGSWNDVPPWQQTFTCARTGDYVPGILKK